MAIDPKLVDIASQYMGPEELDRLKDMMSLSRKEYLNRFALHSGIIQSPQALGAEIEWNLRPNAEDRFIIGRLKFENRCRETESGRISITLNRIVLKPMEVEIAPGIRVDIDLDLEKVDFTDSMVPFDRPVPCSVVFTDGYGREVLSSSHELTFVRLRSESLACATLVPSEADPGDGPLSLGVLNVTPFGQGYSHITVSVTQGDDEILNHRISVEQNRCVGVPLVLHGASLPAYREYGFTVSASCGDTEFFRNAVHVISGMGRSADPRRGQSSAKRIFGECRFQRAIDVHEAREGAVKLGELALINLESEPQQVSVDLTVGGSQMLFNREVLAPSSESNVILECTALSLFKQEAYSADICCRVTDSEGSTILCRTMTANILSQYDMDLHQLPVRTVEFIDPFNASVKGFVDDRKGPLARAMEDGYSVTGYQIPNRVISQMKAVYDALKEYGLSYVSDTNTIESGFQRVRSPDKVLEDHSGNCIELSILFASIFESMGLEPVVVFPKGHAIAGVVTGTNVYDSEAKSSGSDAMTLRIDLGGSRYFEAVFIECTMCPYGWASFSNAVEEAHSTVSEETEYISRKGRYALVKKMRNDGVGTVFR